MREKNSFYIGLLLLAASLFASSAGAEVMTVKSGDVIKSQQAGFSLQFMEDMDLNVSTVYETDSGLAFDDRWFNLSSDAPAEKHFLWELNYSSVEDGDEVLRLSSNVSTGTTVEYGISGLSSLGSNGEYLLKYDGSAVDSFSSTSFDWSRSYSSEPENYTVVVNRTIGNVTVDFGLKNKDGSLKDSKLKLKKNSNGKLVFSTDTAGKLVNREIDTGVYDLQADFAHIVELIGMDMNSNMSINLSVDDVPETALSFNGTSTDEITGLALETTASYDSGSMKLNYSGHDLSKTDISVWKCANWDIEARSCTGSWSSLSGFTVDEQNKNVAVDVNSFSAYAIGEFNGSSGSSDGSSGSSSGGSSGGGSDGSGGGSSSSGGGGGGFFGGSSGTDSEETAGLVSREIKVEMYPGQTSQETLELGNRADTEKEITLEAADSSFIQLSQTTATIESNSSIQMPVTLDVPSEAESSVYRQSINISSDDASYSTDALIIVRSRTEGEKLDMDLVMHRTAKDGKVGWEYDVGVYNLGLNDSAEFNLSISLSEIRTGEVINSFSEKGVSVEESYTFNKSILDLSDGTYRLSAELSYGDEKVEHGRTFTVSSEEPPTIFGLKPKFISNFLLLMSGIMMAVGVYLYNTRTGRPSRGIDWLMNKIGAEYGGEKQQNVPQNDNKGSKSDVKQEVSELKEETTRLENRKKELQQKLQDNQIDQAQYEEQIKGIEKREQEIMEELSRLEEEF